MPSLTRRMRRPWVGLCASVWVQLAAGTAYTFPLFSHSLKSAMGFNQHQLTLLGVANDIGENVGLLPGLVCNKFPPWVVFLIGAVLCFLGYGALWLAFTRAIPYFPYWALWFALCIAANSNAWFTTGVLVTNINNFPQSRGEVSGILKGYGGLSAAVYTEVYSVLLNSSSPDLLLFLTLGVPTVCLIMMFFIRRTDPVSGNNPSAEGHFYFLQGASALLGIYVLATNILGNLLSLSVRVSISLVIVMVLLLLAPLGIPVKITFHLSNHGVSPQQDQDNSDIAAPLLDQIAASNAETEEPVVDTVASAASNPEIEEPVVDTVASEASNSEIEELLADTVQSAASNPQPEEPLIGPVPLTASLGSPIDGEEAPEVGMHLTVGVGAIGIRSRPRRGEDFTLADALVKADFWLLFLVYFAGVGTGVTVLNNLAQIGIAQHMHDTKVLLSLFSFCNFLGRLGGGVASECLCRARAIPRTIWMAITQLVMVATYLLFASALRNSLYFATTLLGICYGFQFSIMVPTVTELFGLKHFGMIFNFISLGNPLGAYMFSNLLAGHIYDMEAERQQTKTCVGPNCFRLVFDVLAGVCVVGTILSIYLTKRILPVYRTLYSGGSINQPGN